LAAIDLHALEFLDEIPAASVIGIFLQGSHNALGSAPATPDGRQPAFSAHDQNGWL
jgi:hypothetical protein